MSAHIYPLFLDVLHRAKREGITITCEVMRANDEIWLVRFGPRGGWRKLKRT